MTAGQKDFIIEKNADWVRILTYKETLSDGYPGDAIDITDYDFKMTIRDTIGGTALFTLTVGDGITILTPASAGQFKLEIPKEELTGVTQRVGVYDLLLVDDDDNTKRLLQGNIVFSDKVTDPS